MSDFASNTDPFHDAPWRALWEAATARRALAARPLTGGISAETVLIDYISPAGMLCQAIARKHGPVDLARNPRIAWDELALLNVLREANISAPHGIGVSDAGYLPTPVLLISFVEGTHEPPVTDHPERAASLLAAIHRCPLDERLARLPRVVTAIPSASESLDTSLSEGKVRAALASVEPPRTGETTLLHGDYWPGNLLWPPDGHTVAIDWEDAAIGDPLADLANARLEWRLTYNAASANRFTRQYAAEAGRNLDALPWWDLRAALRLCGRLDSFGLDPVTEHRWRAKHHRFIATAIARLERPSN